MTQQDCTFSLYSIMNSQNKPTFIIKTLGCKVNQYETQAMTESLLREGFLESNDKSSADFLIINSCTVTKKADKDTRSFINNFHKTCPSGKIVIVGCYAEQKSDREEILKIPGVFKLLTNKEKANIASVLAPNVKENRSYEITDFKNRDRAFIKIQDGCNHRCSYCKVRIVRGASESRKIDDILKEINLIIKKGFKEIILTGICLGAWGKDLDNRVELTDLLDRIKEIEGEFRIRLSSIEPNYISDKLIDVMMASPKICKHLHVPLQSGDDKILKAMKRPYTRKQFFQLIKKIRKKIPNIAITTDVIVGFPGEERRNFKHTVNLLKKIKPSRMHIFPYSKREGTEAFKYKKDVIFQIKKERVKILMDLAKILSFEYAKKFISKDSYCLVETQRDKKTNFLVGYTDRYVRVFLEGPDSLRNSLVKVKITGVDSTKNIVLGRLDNANVI